MPPACWDPSVRPWKAFSKLIKTCFLRPPTLMPCARLSLMAHSTVSEPVVSRKTFFSGRGSKPEMRSTRPRANLAGEAVVGQQTRVGLPRDGIYHFLAGHGPRW